MFFQKSYTEDLENLANQVDTPPDTQQLEQAGFIRNTQPTNTSNVNEETSFGDKVKQTADNLGIERPKDGKQYKDSKFDLGTLKDAALSLSTEASHIFVPKNHELQYEPQTRVGETLKYGYRYLAGTAAFMLPTGWVGGAVKGLSSLPVLAKTPKIAKLLFGVGKAVKGENISMKTAVTFAKEKGINTKAAAIGAKALNATTEGAVAGVVADYTLYRPEDNEGHIADMFGETNNAILNFMQTHEDDTEATAKFKNVIDGLFVGTLVGNIMEFSGAKVLLENSFKFNTDIFFLLCHWARNFLYTKRIQSAHPITVLYN